MGKGPKSSRFLCDPRVSATKRAHAHRSLSQIPGDGPLSSPGNSTNKRERHDGEHIFAAHLLLVRQSTSYSSHWTPWGVLQHQVPPGRPPPPPHRDGTPRHRGVRPSAACPAQADGAGRADHTGDPYRGGRRRVRAAAADGAPAGPRREAHSSHGGQNQIARGHVGPDRRPAGHDRGHRTQEVLPAHAPRRPAVGARRAAAHPGRSRRSSPRSPGWACLPHGSGRRRRWWRRHRRPVTALSHTGTGTLRHARHRWPRPSYCPQQSPARFRPQPACAGQPRQPLPQFPLPRHVRRTLPLLEAHLLDRPCLRRRS